MRAWETNKSKGCEQRFLDIPAKRFPSNPSWKPAAGKGSAQSSAPRLTDRPSWRTQNKIPLTFLDELQTWLFYKMAFPVIGKKKIGGQESWSPKLPLRQKGGNQACIATLSFWASGWIGQLVLETDLSVNMRLPLFGNGMWRKWDGVCCCEWALGVY